MSSCPMCAFVKLPILAATLASFSVGMLWYSPMAFGKIWMKVCDIKPDSSGKSISGARPLVGALLMDYLSAGVLAFLLDFMQVRCADGGFMIGIVLAIGFIFPSLATSALFEKKPISYVAIVVGHRIVALALAGAMLGGWR